MGKLYHPNCFKCEVCKKALNGKKFTRDGDSVLCVECYQVRNHPFPPFSAKYDLRFKKLF